MIASPNINKAPTGIEGFDEISSGGLPRGRTSLLMGGPGTGKTVFALQSLVRGVRELDEPGIFVTFEEDARRIVDNSRSFGWGLDEINPDKLYFMDARLSPQTIKSGEFDLSLLLAGLQAKAEEMKARRVVLDGIDVLLTLLDDPAAERWELYRLHEALQAGDLTTLITTKLSTPRQEPRYDFLQFMVDCAVEFDHRLYEDISLRRLRITKYRGSSYSENEFPLTIGKEGANVAGLSALSADQPVYTDRVSTGVSRLDGMLGGGYFRGSGILVSGSPGTAKSTLASAFAAATCRQGGGALYIAFDESPPEIVRNMSSVGIALQRFIDDGLLHIDSAKSERFNAEEHFMAIRDALDRHKPQALIVDPLSALMKSGGAATAHGVVNRLMQLAKQRGLTCLCTSLLESHGADVESTSIHVSTIADVWIHLSYNIRGGERNRALTVIKSRGMEHSNQVRELLLSSEGVELQDVYTAGGEVLMGTARWEKEEQERRESRGIRTDLEQQRAELMSQERASRSQIVELQAQLGVLNERLAALDEERRRYEESEEHKSREIRRRRGGGKPRTDGGT